MLTTKNRAPGSGLPPDTRKTVSSTARAAGSFIPKLAAKAFEKYGFHSAEIMTAWARVAGADIATFTEPERIKWPRGPDVRDPGESLGAASGATLILRVDPARALDIEYRAAEIIDRINRYFGYRAIARLTLIQAPVSVRSPPANADAATAASLAEPPPGLETLLKAGPEAGLKAALTGLWASIASERGRR